MPARSSVPRRSAGAARRRRWFDPARSDDECGTAASTAATAIADRRQPGRIDAPARVRRSIAVPRRLDPSLSSMRHGGGERSIDPPPAGEQAHGASIGARRGQR